MAYYSVRELESFKFKFLGKNVKISNKASIYNAETLSIGDNSRIDDFCVISGRVSIGRNVHITPFCLVAGGSPGIILSDFSTLAYGCKVFSQSDDYSGNSLVNSTIPRKFKSEIFSSVYVGRQAIIGASSVVMPGVRVEEGCSIGAGAVVINSTAPWSIYVGVPARKVSEKSKQCISLLEQYLQEEINDKSSI
ncbi:acyltransferase [Vibrio aestuarianus]|uniref:acyltransferase n=1 Tax=Vibrio aestuarianus TaxID=28171 RepID=UPI00237CCF08|nr:acyltransferase [Vibrio aestuarianus]MDE1335107.1 acyltransferase [Vibrio aestuarianus]